MPVRMLLKNYILCILLIAISCKAPRPNGSIAANPNQNLQKAQNAGVQTNGDFVIPSVPPAEKVDGSQLKVQGFTLTSVPTIGDQTGLQFAAVPDDNADYFQFAICTISTPQVCSPSKDKPGSFSLTSYTYPNPPSGTVVGYLQNCSRAYNLLDPSKPCGPWFEQTTIQKPNSNPKVGLALLDADNQAKQLLGQCQQARVLVQQKLDSTTFTNSVADQSRKNILQNFLSSGDDDCAESMKAGYLNVVSAQDKLSQPIGLNLTNTTQNDIGISFVSVGSAAFVAGVGFVFKAGVKRGKIKTLQAKADALKTDPFTLTEKAAELRKTYEKYNTAQTEFNGVVNSEDYLFRPGSALEDSNLRKWAKNLELVEKLPKKNFQNAFAILEAEDATKTALQNGNSVVIKDKFTAFKAKLLEDVSLDDQAILNSDPRMQKIEEYQDKLVKAAQSKQTAKEEQPKLENKIREITTLGVLNGGAEVVPLVPETGLPHEVPADFSEISPQIKNFVTSMESVASVRERERDANLSKAEGEVTVAKEGHSGKTALILVGGGSLLNVIGGPLIATALVDDSFTVTLNNIAAQTQKILTSIEQSRIKAYSILDGNQ